MELSSLVPAARSSRVGAACQTGNHNLFADVERAQVLFARLGADFCHGFPPQEGTTHSGGKFLNRGYAACSHIISSKSRLPLDGLPKCGSNAATRGRSW